MKDEARGDSKICMGLCNCVPPDNPRGDVTDPVDLQFLLIAASFFPFVNTKVVCDVGFCLEQSVTADASKRRSLILAVTVVLLLVLHLICNGNSFVTMHQVMSVACFS